MLKLGNRYVKKECLMGNEQKVITFQEFSSHPAEVFDSVLDGTEIIVQRGEGEAIVLMPSVLADEDAVLQEKIEAILEAAGSWADVDTDELLTQLRASRNLNRSHFQRILT
jgi:hypothetical protein